MVGKDVCAFFHACCRSLTRRLPRVWFVTVAYMSPAPTLVYVLLFSASRSADRMRSTWCFEMLDMEEEERVFEIDQRG